ncbi:dihydrofolate reductase [Sulfitobacter faviae]|uniref:Dihydrofolate reductase n=1 Tax=Sulfitobacter faviae TaxID=1775881 RepID=A0ABZ0UWG4_9RHOB|nr:dihydrofolate reductase [Sulfitobacter faviae]WPZ20958.1 dihydrofolate reductase [Sulfitobacter faviae]
MLSLIVARARNGAIGKDGDIPWSLPEDLKFFQRETTGGAIIMGRRTWESLPFKPLKNRLNCVVSSSEVEGVHVARDPQAALGYCAGEGYRRVYGIGGEGIYRALLPLADRLLVTEVDVEIDGADAFFPEFDTDEWIELGNLCLRTSGPRAIAQEWLRRC